MSIRSLIGVDKEAAQAKEAIEEEKIKRRSFRTRIRKS